MRFARHDAVALLQRLVDLWDKAYGEAEVHAPSCPAASQHAAGSGRLPSMAFPTSSSGASDLCAPTWPVNEFARLVQNVEI